MKEKKTLYEMAKALRSKNSGPFELTMDVIFDNKSYYDKVKDSGIITKELICKLYNIEEKDISALVFFDPAMAFKVTIRRPIDSGSIGETDVYGSQQHAPLMDILIPV
jgi:hypothetical protein